MGSSSWSDDHYKARVADKAAKGISTFAYDAAVKASSDPSVKRAHPTLDPKGVTIRESRDSKDHPNSRAIAVFFDVTGSMGEQPRMLQKKLTSLMNLLLAKAYLADPQIMFGATGDAECDTAPLQVGQFESGVEMDEHLSNLYIEQGGGGGRVKNLPRESYELAMFFLARHTSMDCLEKRGERGYAFIICDEAAYDELLPQYIEQFLGYKVEDKLTVEQIVDELNEKFETFIINLNYPGGQPHNQNTGIRERWKQLFPQHVIELPNPELICEVIACQIGLSEGVIDESGAIRDLNDIGCKSATAVAGALVPVDPSKAGKKASVTGELVASGATSGAKTL